MTGLPEIHDLLVQLGWTPPDGVAPPPEAQPEMRRQWGFRWLDDDEVFRVLDERMAREVVAAFAVVGHQVEAVSRMVPLHETKWKRA